MIPERIRLLWQLMDAHEKGVKVLNEIEATLGDSLLGKSAKAHLREQRDLMRRIMYAAFYESEPPVELPDNWEGE